MNTKSSIIESLEDLPAGISFFCPVCVHGTAIKTKPRGEPMECHNCNNTRLQVAYAPIEELTQNYCKPLERFQPFKLADGVFFVLLINTDYLSELVDLNDLTDAVRTARYIKDRFFFTRPLPDDIVLDVNFFTDITWIPK